MTSSAAPAEKTIGLLCVNLRKQTYEGRSKSFATRVQNSNELQMT